MKKFLATIPILALLIFSNPGHAHATTGPLIKGASFTSVYYYGNDGKRYVFPNDKTFLSWYSDFSGMTIVSDTELASIPIGGNVTYRPGKKLVKVQTDPKVYAVDKNGTLRWIVSEAVASALYGSDWAKKVDDVPDIFFVNYKIGAAVTSATDFNADNLLTTIQSISDDKASVAVVQAPTPAQTVTPTPQPTNVPSRPSITRFEASKNPAFIGDDLSISWAADNATTCLFSTQKDVAIPFTGRLPNLEISYKVTTLPVTLYLICADENWYTNVRELTIQKDISPLLFTSNLAVSQPTLGNDGLYRVGVTWNANRAATAVNDPANQVFHPYRTYNLKLQIKDANGNVAEQGYSFTTGSFTADPSALGASSPKTVVFADERPQPFNSSWVDVSGDYNFMAITLSITGSIAGYDVHYTNDPTAGDSTGFSIQGRIDCGWGATCPLTTVPILARYYRVSTGTASGNVVAQGYLIKK